MKKQNSKVYKLKLGKGTKIKIEVRSNFVLPRALRPLCNKSLLKKILKTPENIIFAFLNLLALGFEHGTCCQTLSEPALNRGVVWHNTTRA